MQIVDSFMNEFEMLLDKYDIDSVILYNDDNGQMGHHQLTKIIKSEGNKFLVMKFSGSDKTLCPCCAEK